MPLLVEIQEAVLDPKISTFGIWVSIWVRLCGASRVVVPGSVPLSSSL